MSARSTLEKLHGRTAAGVPRWAVRTAYVTSLTALPAGIWRIAAFTFDAPLLEPSTEPVGGDAILWWYVIVLSVISEALAFLAIGLVSEWGERWPRWIPFLGGRPVPTLAAVIPAGLGAAALMVLPYSLLMGAFGLGMTGEPSGLVTHGYQTVLFWLCYLPLGLWGPLLAVLTVHYHRRRNRPAARPRPSTALAA
ncbi:hypothetical protein [Kitasatospora sp. NPDC093806]|uniref:hypothetical protein n=1 Tax=Kitasatospora sp. NPDC093806 TaxID=3155075 RepID=UPI00342FAF92